jgi:glucose 1-dehydrogenase
MQRLAGKNVLITGASSGIGQAIAIRFAQEGANVAINYLADPAEAEATRAAAGGRSIIVQADVSREDQVKEMFTKVADAFGSVDVLINNAGIQKLSVTENIEMEDFDRVLNA